MSGEVKFCEVEDFPGYRIGNDGSFWSCWSMGNKRYLKEEWRELKVTINNAGYPCVTIYRDTKKFTLTIHSLLMHYFKERRPFPKAQCRHLDGNPSNNNLDNLKWGSATENARDKLLHGTDGRGINNSCAILNEDKVREIRVKIANGARNPDIALEYGVNVNTISAIRTGRSWGHVV